MSCFRRIMYVDCFEDGCRKENAGYVKITKVDGRMNLWINLPKLRDKDSVSCIVRLVGELPEKECEKIGGLQLVKGCGILNAEGLEQFVFGEENVSWGDVWLRMEWGEQEYAECKICETAKKECGDIAKVEVACDMQEEPAEMWAAEQTREMMHGDKWMQLSATKKHLQPFDDEREYLQMSLGDLIVLPDRYYRMAENSFLLHGYYNYGHLVLAKTPRQGNEKIMLGVPGNYYEKEACAAVMFGFESFESKREPAPEGEFGYYFISVEL